MGLRLLSSLQSCCLIRSSSSSTLLDREALGTSDTSTKTISESGFQNKSRCGNKPCSSLCCFSRSRSSGFRSSYSVYLFLLILIFTLSLTKWKTQGGRHRTWRRPRTGWDYKLLLWCFYMLLYQTYDNNSTRWRNDICKIIFVLFK